MKIDGTESSLGGGVTDGQLTILAGNSGDLVYRSGSGAFELEHHSSGVDFSAIIALGEGRYLMVGEGGTHHYPEDGDKDS